MDHDGFAVRFTAALDSPCTKCYTQARNRLAICLANAKNEAEKKVCRDQAVKDNAACQAGPCK